MPLTTQTKGVLQILVVQTEFPDRQSIPLQASYTRTLVFLISVTQKLFATDWIQ